MPKTREILFEFNQKKAVEAILYLARRIDDPSYMRLAKLLYFADKTSLEKYGRFIFGDTYYAMKFGPVPSNIYEQMKHKASGDFQVVNDRDIKPLRDADLDELSESDIACLDQVIEYYKYAPTWKLSAESHDQAWAKAWESRGDRASNRIPLESIVEMFEDGDLLLDFLLNPDED